MRRLINGAIALALLAVTSCNFDVVNPGPVQDQNLDDPGAHLGFVNGARAGALWGLSSTAHYGGGVSREGKPSGGVGAGGMNRDYELGVLHDENSLPGWDNLHQGRWIGEHGIERMKKSMGAQADKYAPLGQMYLWAGFANRILGESRCTAVFDGGKPEPYKNYLTRAIEHFKNAEKVANAAGDKTTATGAVAARAAAYAYIGSWNEAATEAAKVSVSFKFQAQYANEDRYRITEAMNGFFRSFSLVQTRWEKYFLDTGDPRVAWGFDNTSDATRYGETPRATTGRTFFYYALKFYAPRNADERTKFIGKILEQEMYKVPVNLTTGREMLLIRAEALLAQGKWQEAMTLINQVRTTTADPRTGKLGNYFTGQALAAKTATSLTDAWTALKDERGAELFWEGRRLGDRRRWAENKTPGALHILEYVPAAQASKYSVPREPALCGPVPRGEKETNPNVGLDYQDTVTRDAKIG